MGFGELPGQRTRGYLGRGVYLPRAYPPCIPSTGCSSESFIITCNKLLKVSVYLSLVAQEPKEGGCGDLEAQVISWTWNRCLKCVLVCVLGGCFVLWG